MLLRAYNVHEVRIQALYYIIFLSSGIDSTLQYSTTYILWWKVKSYATFQNFGVCEILKKKEINTFILQRHINLMKSDSKDMYVTKDFYFKCCSFQLCSWNNPDKTA